MSALIVESLNNRFHSRDPLDAGRCAQWLAALSEVDGDSLAAELVSPDEWLLIRDLSIKAQWCTDAPDVDIVDYWRKALKEALVAAHATPTRSDVVRYAHRRAALADLFYRSALGDMTRQWAWQRMGIIAHVPITPTEALRQGLRELFARPDLIWPVLQRLIDGEPTTASLSAVLRALPQTDWLQLLRTTPRSSTYVEQLERVRTATESVTVVPSSREARTLLNWAAARTAFCMRYIDILSVLVAALTVSGQGMTPSLAYRALQMARALLVHSLQAARVAYAPAPYTQLPSSLAESQTTSIPPRGDHLPPLPTLDATEDSSEWLPTEWAGALFWLAQIPSSGLLDWHATKADADPICTPSLYTLLHRLGLVLGIPDDDPALRAFCGGNTVDNVSAESRALLQEPIVTCISAWSAWLDLNAPELEAPRLATVSRRRGSLHFEPSWIELHLPLDEVNTSVRRLGLDLNPGWLPWLGCVLRIFYDE